MRPLPRSTVSFARLSNPHPQACQRDHREVARDRCSNATQAPLVLSVDRRLTFVTDPYYERYWSEEGYNPRKGGTPPNLQRLYTELIRPSDDVIDVGCGDGGTSGHWVTDHANSYVGVDVSENAVELARQDGLHAELIRDGELPFPDRTFDVALSIEVFEHLLEPQVLAASTLRVLRPGGRLIATVPNGAHWRDRADMLIGKWTPRGDDLGRSQPWRSPHIRFFNPASLEQMLRHSGFDQVEVRGLVGASFLETIPGLRRFAGDVPSLVYQAVARARPAIVATGLIAIATRAHS